MRLPGSRGLALRTVYRSPGRRELGLAFIRVVDGDTASTYQFVSLHGLLHKAVDTSDFHTPTTCNHGFDDGFAKWEVFRKSNAAFALVKLISNTRIRSPSLMTAGY